MKKIILLLLILPLLTACGDDEEKIEIPTRVYNDSKLTIDIVGLNEAVLVSPSIVSSGYSDGKTTIVINNVININSSIIEANITNGQKGFDIEKTTDRYTTKLNGIISDGDVYTLTGTVKYTAKGVAREYKNLTLIINNAASTANILAEISYTPTKDEPNKADIKITEIIDSNDRKKDKIKKTTGTLIEGDNNIFTLVASGSDDETLTEITDVTGTFNQGILVITITSTPKG